jgi:glycerophosphoryl diester phosphodiesterase
VHCAHQHLTPAWAAEVKRSRYALAVYTVNDPSRAKEVLAWGADSLITDRPDEIMAALAGEAACLTAEGRTERSPRA